IRHAPEHTALTLSLVSDRQFAALTIRDDGPGISSALRERLFQPFSAGQSRSGSGLGLMICREIVTALGGQITLDNRMQHARVVGLDAIVRLPLASAESARTDAVRAGPDGSRTA
ncbi:MAG: ATP-binding protein, partial [Rhodoferax sp.]|nr:ATP-binding protein [Rhodoferax sp.]